MGRTEVLLSSLQHQNTCNRERVRISFKSDIYRQTLFRDVGINLKIIDIRNT